MFRLEDPFVVVTQQEHARLAARMAAEWGNADFDRPPFDFGSFVEGVTLHDWHFGFFDTFPLDDLDGGVKTTERQREWLEIAERGLGLAFDDPVAEVVAKRHLLRLVSSEDIPEARAVADRLRGALAGAIPEAGLTEDAVEFADGVTKLCDGAAFHVFRIGTGSYWTTLRARGHDPEPTRVTVTIDTGARVTIDPWPFGCAPFACDLLAFERGGYPGTLAPRTLRIEVARVG